ESTGAPLEGVQVHIPDTNIGQFTDAEDRYVLADVPTGETVVRANLLGYRPVERTVRVPEGGTVTVDFQLPSTAIELEEIVASVEAREVRRRELGTDIAAIDVEQEIELAAVESFSDLLNARAANVRISPASGLLGAGSQIRIRGTNSLTQDNNPLIVIDGVRVTNDTDLGPIATGGQTASRFDDLNPSDIADIQVIKGPSATALYGSEAATGVIVITTEAGSRGESRFSFSARGGFAENPADFPDTYMNVTPAYGVTSLDDPRIAQFRAEQHPLSGDIFVLDNPLMDPDSRPFRRGGFSVYDLDYRTGSDRAMVYTSLSVQDRNGVVTANDLSRISWRGNAQLSVHPNVDLSFNSGYITSERNFPDDNSTGTGMGVGGMLGSPLSSYGTDPQEGAGKGICLLDALLEQPNGTSGLCEGRNGNFSTTFDKLMSVDQGEKVTRMTTSGTATWRATADLTTSLTVGVDDTGRRVWDLVPYDPDLPFGAASLGRITDHRDQNRILTADWRASLGRPLTDRISTTTTLGAQYFGTRTEAVTCSGADFPSDDVRSCDAAETARGSSAVLENIEVGAFFQERVGYDNYLFVTGAMRVDDNSSLGDRADAIWSPSANVSAVLSEMPFWNAAFVDELRLRAAWGKASQSPRQYQADRTFASTPVLVDGGLWTGITPQDPGNDALGPERSEEFEVGLDAGVLDDRIGLTFTYFRSSTTDMIVPAPVSPSTGFPGLSFINLGEMENAGLELNVDWSVLQRDDFAWDLNVQLSTVDPVITDLGLSAPIIFPQGADGGSRAAGSQAFQTGFAPGVYISPVITHAERDADGNIVPGSIEYAPGNLGDGSDRRVVGQPFATNDESVSSTLTFRDRLRLHVLVDRSGGHELLNVTRAFRTPFVDTPESSSYSREYAYRQTLFSPEEQAMIEERILAAFIEPADFIKLREVTLSYDLPSRLVAMLPGASDATFTLGGRNLYTWTEFTGIDPEMNVRGARDEFIRNNFAGSFPPLRSFWANLRVSF
ncbi:MAG: SusC/RagA family TonB-linked outer membrane protein, partial [Gemmatimonadota bacterium]